MNRVSDLFTLFDGSMGSGGSAVLSKQHASAFSSIASENDAVATMASGSDSIELLIDYSDFSNFITFNSAESYATVTADQILNAYPRDGSADDVRRFLDSLDGYQRFFLRNWPSRTGYLRFDSSISSSFVRIDDFGVQDGVARTSFVNPGTGSLSVQGWIDLPLALTIAPPNAKIPIFYKGRTDGSGSFHVFVSGALVNFTVTSGSTSVNASAPITSGSMFFSAVLDRTGPTGSLNIYTATTSSFPTLASSVQIPLGRRLDLTSGSFFLGAAPTASPFTGSMDSISVWSSARTLADMTGTYNRRIYSQPNLLGLWNFNDATPTTAGSYGSIVRDSSGHRLDGRIQSFYPALLASGSIAFDSPDPILSLDDPDVVSYVLSAQASGVLYDRNNPSLIFNLFPESFSRNDRESSDVFGNFALILARHFDRIKTYANQLVNLRRVNFGSHDQAPNKILDQVARSFGWDLGGGFVTADALQYFIGRSVRPGPQGNDSVVLADVKSAFWKRVLLNLMHLYKTKGTGESVEALLRIYGVDNGFVRLKEYARRSEGTISLKRVVAEKSVFALMFSSGSNITFVAPA